MKKLLLVVIALLLFMFPATAEHPDTNRVQEFLGIDFDGSTPSSELYFYIKKVEHLISECYALRIDLVDQYSAVERNLDLLVSPSSLDGLTYEELVAIRDMIDMAMWQSREWKEVLVPEGIWVVGEDIPAGHWTIYCPEGQGLIKISWGETMNHKYGWIIQQGRYDSCTVYPRSYFGYTAKKQYDFEVINGDFIIIEYGPAIFVPYAGKPDLGFDWGE